MHARTDVSGRVEMPRHLVRLTSSLEKAEKAEFVLALAARLWNSGTEDHPPVLRRTPLSPQSVREAYWSAASPPSTSPKDGARYHCTPPIFPHCHIHISCAFSFQSSLFLHSLPLCMLRRVSATVDRHPCDALQRNHIDELAGSLKSVLLIMSSSGGSGNVPSIPPIPKLPQSKEELKVDLNVAKRKSFAGLRSLAAGGVGGVCAVIVGHPFDLVKVRLQTADKGVYSGAMDVVRRTIAREGLARVCQAPKHL